MNFLKGGVYPKFSTKMGEELVVKVKLVNVGSKLKNIIFFLYKGRGELTATQQLFTTDISTRMTYIVQTAGRVHTSRENQFSRDLLAGSADSPRRLPHSQRAWPHTADTSVL